MYIINVLNEDQYTMTSKNKSMHGLRTSQQPLYGIDVDYDIQYNIEIIKEVC